MSVTAVDGPLQTSPTQLQGPTLGRLVAVELRKMIDTRAGFWLLVSNALIAVASVVVRLIWSPAEEQTLAHFFSATVEATSVLLPVLGILAVTSEWSQRTALTTFTLVPRRERVIAAKLVRASHWR
jgi:ABC-2 type transport system permease protein